MKGTIWRADFHGRGHEQHGRRYAVVIQSDSFPWLSTWLVAPTTGSDSAAEALFRPNIVIDDESGRVLLEHARAFDPQRLGDYVGEITQQVQANIDQGLRLLLDLPEHR